MLSSVMRRRYGLISIACLFAATMAGTTLPTPLYPLYQRELDYSALTSTVIYAVYAAGVLVVLLFFGRASDLLGRRPVLAGALGASALSGLIFILDSVLVAGGRTGWGLGLILLARVVSGLSAGLVTAAATAALVESAATVRRARAAATAATVNMLGLGIGPLLAGVLAEYAPQPLRLPFVVHLVLLVGAGFVVWRMRETVPQARRAPIRRAVRPQRLGVPASTRAVFVPAALAAFAAFAVFGLLSAVEPGLLATVLHRPDHLLAGASVFTMFASSAAAQTLTRRWGYALGLPTGCLILLAGLGVIAAALAAHSLIALVLGTVVVGLGHGTSFRAGMAAVGERAPADRRAETVAAFMVVAYVGISVPVVLVGVVSAAVGLFSAALAFIPVVAAVALAAAAAVRAHASVRGTATR